MGKSRDKQQKVNNDTSAKNTNVTTGLSDDDLDVVFGGETVVKEVYASNSIVVRDRITGEVLCVLPY